MITFAPDHFAALLGAEVKRSVEGKTNWVEPCLQTLEDVEIAFLRDGYWWKHALQHTESLCAIEKLDMIQWMPGEGYYDDDWHPGGQHASES